MAKRSDKTSLESSAELAPPEKREQILQGATTVFLQHGYAGTSMDRVAAAAGVSKQTIYSHFQDKEGLFTALIERVTIERLQHELGADHLSGDPKLLLRQLAQAFLHKMRSQDYLNVLRIIIAESVRFPELAQLYSRTVLVKGRQLLVDYLNQHPELKIADPEAMAHNFSGTLVSFLLAQEILYGKEFTTLTGERVIDQLIDLVLSREQR